MSASDIQGLADFLQRSPTPFHAVENMLERFRSNGFRQLHEQDAWQLEAGQRYVLQRNHSSIAAFTWPGGTPEQLALVGAHTDSPCLRLMPNPLVLSQGHVCLRVQVYGGALLYPWFDRDLGLAGRVVVALEDGSHRSVLVNTPQPIGIVPSLAIHLDRGANSGRTVNPDTEMRVVTGMANKLPEMPEWLQGVFANLPGKPLAWELSLYDAQPPAVVAGQFLTSARLDNLLSCHVAGEAMLQAPEDRFCALVCHDHEEVGSRSWAGAQGDMLSQVLQRLLPDAEARARLLAGATMLSVDNAHGVHPNFSAHHAGGHMPMLGSGPVLKLDSEQRYAGDSEAWAGLRALAQRVGVPLQSFAVRPDMACGSTIGPISAANLGLRVLDLGAPQWAMHSIRESAHCDDAESLQRLIGAFYAQGLES